MVGLLGAAAAAVRLLRFFNQGRAPGSAAFQLLSMAVPLKGMNPVYERALRALLEARLSIPVEYLLVMETEADPAHAFCRQLQDEYPDMDIRVLLSGPAGGRMGKQHNLAAAAAAASGEVFGSMDADVVPEPDLLQFALDTLAASAGGSVFLLPGYEHARPPGGRLTAAYTNHFFALNIGSMAAGAEPEFTIGSLWMIGKAVLDRIGGLEPFTSVVTDDAAIGRAVSRMGGRNTLCPRAVRLQPQQESLMDGLKQLQKWVVMLRAEGLISFLVIFLLWHPGFFALASLIPAFFLGQPFLLASSILMLAWLLIRSAVVFNLDRRIYTWNSPMSNIAAVAGYELFAAPMLFAVGLFRRSLVWGGRRYGIGKHGLMRSVEDVEGE